MKRAAFALPLVLWSVAFLSAIALLLVGTVGRWLDDETLAEHRFAARQHALTGLALGRNPALSPGDPLLNTGDANRDGHAVRITEESSRINPNYWIVPERRVLFQELFTAWDVNPRDQNAAVDGMADWIDPDDLASLNGAERGQYESRGHTGLPPNEPFVSVAELEAVIGLQDILAARENWKDVFTVHYAGKINILHASVPLLEALAGFSAAQARAFAELRAGADGILGSPDDPKFSSLEQIAEITGAGADQTARLEQFFTTGKGVRRIESTGWVQGASYRIAVVAGDDGRELLSWEEQ